MNQRLPKHVSVIIPAFNRASLLIPTLDSVLAQTYRDFDVIVVDDGSTDHTREVVERYAGCVKYIYQDNRERGAARNRGIRQSQGEFVAFLDSDDLWQPDHLSKSVAVLSADPGCGLVWSDVTWMDQEGKDLYLVSRRGPRRRTLRSLLQNNYIPQSSVVVRRDCFETVGFYNEDRDLAGSEDWELWLRIVSRYSIEHVPDNSIRLRWHADSTTMFNPKNAERSVLRALDLIQSNPHLTPFLPLRFDSVYASHFWKIGMIYYTVGQMKDCRHSLLKALRKSRLLGLRPQFWWHFFRSFLDARTAEFLRMQKVRVLKKLG